ncbi:MAG: sigma-54-dependent Fis family transcriptional regulator [Candidatus Cloacimonetes bacterium]|nr:sigma-54-dependent Fis family transcriptional regulator [Candidatus Cloacimonadota bacterium]
MKILVIEDDNNQRKLLQDFLDKNGYQTATAADGEEGISVFKQNLFDLVITDFRMPRKNGLEVLQEIKKINPLSAVIIITAFSDISDAVSVIKEGAVDYILKPINLQELLNKLKQIRGQIDIQKESREVFLQMPELDLTSTLITKSPRMKEILSIVQRVSRNSAAVLLTGESGTGKELVAELIHEIGPRKDKKLVKVNCAALPDTLLESELFGHVRGSFTGADRDRKGRFEEADGGTIFLDEIGEISPLIQVKLLRVLQNMNFEPVGSSRTRSVDVRIISATNKKLEDEILRGNFREDLYYRLNVVPIHLPPLRERKEDIPLLLDFFLEELKVNDVFSFSQSAVMKLMSFNWEGNIRQLRNLVIRVVTLARNNVITAEELPDNLSSIRDDKTVTETMKLEEVEKAHILKVLQLCGGNQKKAAEQLGIHRNTLARKIREYNIKLD